MYKCIACFVYGFVLVCYIFYDYGSLDCMYLIPNKNFCFWTKKSVPVRFFCCMCPCDSPSIRFHNHCFGDKLREIHCFLFVIKRIEGKYSNKDTCLGDNCLRRGIPLTLERLSFPAPSPIPSHSHLRSPPIPAPSHHLNFCTITPQIRLNFTFRSQISPTHIRSVPVPAHLN